MKKIALFAMLAASALSAQAQELSAEQKELAQAGNDFAFRFLQQIDKNEKRDWFVSPLSLQMLLSVILNGAQDGTATEMARTLGYEAGQLDAVNEYSRVMLHRLTHLDPATKLVIGNAVFVNQDYPIEKKYKKVVEKYYDAEVKNLDFNNGPASLKVINGWCDKQTNGLIPKVLDEVRPDMFAYLLNALYFKGMWADKFRKESTKERMFHLASGQEKKVWMMEQERKLAYREDERCQRLRLDYGKGSFSMYVLLP